MTTARPVVLDTSALLAIALNELGADRVTEVLEGATLNAVNLAEALVVLQRHGITPADARRSITALPLRIATMDAELAERTARIAGATRGHGLSLGDCICLATAQSLGLPALTADRAWARLSVEVEIELAR